MSEFLETEQLISELKLTAENLKKGSRLEFVSQTVFILNEIERLKLNLNHYEKVFKPGLEVENNN